MKLVRNTIASLATLVVVFIVILSGCSGSDPLSTTVGSLVLEFQITDAGSTQYEIANLTLGRATVHAVSQEALDSVGGAGISLLVNEIRNIDLNTASNPLTAAALPAGTFILDEVNFFPQGFIPITLLDNDPDAMAACIDRMPMIPRTFDDDLITTNDEIRMSQGITAVSITRKTLHPNLIINIPSGGTINQPILINSAMLIQAYKNAITCSDNDLVCAVSRGGQVPCITSFNGNAFFDELDTLDWITF